MGKLYIGNLSVVALGNESRPVTASYFSRPRHRRRKSKGRVAREHVLRLSGAWLMDVQEQFSDMAR